MKYKHTQGPWRKEQAIAKARGDDLCYEDVHDYLGQWRDEENWTDLNVALDNGDTVYAAHLMVSAGVIDDKTEIERMVLEVAQEFRRLSHDEQMKHIDETFKGCFVASCNVCNANSFVDCGNETLYPELRTECWECGSKNIETYYWKDKEGGPCTN